MLSILNWLTILIFYSLSLLVCVHVLLHKEDPRAALGWVAVVIALPILGILLYLIFGLNRISTIAKNWEDAGLWSLKVEPSALLSAQSALHSKTSALERLIYNITAMPLEPGMQVNMLVDGDEAYPAMLKAIQGAVSYIYLSSYIFSTRGIGYDFIDALTKAQERGVQVKVLIDGIGSLYSFPTAYRYLKYKKISVALFLPPLRGWYHTLHLNLRNHRKLLIVDGVQAFTGGMNIHRKYLSSKSKSEPKFHDVHFQFLGQNLKYLEYVFAKDWFFATGESIKPAQIQDCSCAKGTAAIRAIPSGPNQSKDVLALLFKGILTTAQQSIQIMTPYFVLDPTLITLMHLAVLRGVCVQIILPEKNNLFFVKAASESILPRLIEFGVQVFYRPGSFAHSKVMIVDQETVFLGSANWDTRSLYLNFELTMQVKDILFLEKVSQHFQGVLGQSRQILIQDLQSCSIVIKLRNAFFRLFSPYL